MLLRYPVTKYAQADQLKIQSGRLVISNTDTSQGRVNTAMGNILFP